MWLQDQFEDVLSLLNEKSNSKEVLPVFPVFFKLFPSLLLNCTVFPTSILITLRVGLCTESWEEWKISQLFLVRNYCRYSILCFTACIQHVKVRTVFIFLGRGLLLKDTESQEDQYLFEICPVEYSVHICHQIAISCVFSYPSHFAACLR